PDAADNPLLREKTPFNRIRLANIMTANAPKVSSREIIKFNSFCQTLVGISCKHTPAHTTNAAIIIRT
ncbi:MAG: hypothetical protein IJG32_07965, partial [Selenomonadaceae bacterium]|nr:hypothetical protein [Selenomonadaceae bacterium]